jgi:hypothetical protein
MVGQMLIVVVMAFQSWTTAAQVDQTTTPQIQIDQMQVSQTLQPTY